MSKTAFLFSGQGAQFVGMGKDIYESSRTVRDLFDFADSLTDGSVTKIAFKGPEDVLKQTIHTQPCMLTYEIALLALANEAGLKADMTAGFSLGEYGAMVAAGVLTFPDALKLMIKRATYMNEAALSQEGKMAAILGGELDALIQICQSVPGYVEAVNFNCPGQVVIAGDVASVNNAIELLSADGFKCIPLSVNGAFHSRHMDGAAQKMAVVLDKVTFATPTIPLISNVSALPEVDFKKLIPVQMASPVLWEKSIRYLVAQGVTKFVEIGPGNVLSGFMKKIDRTLECNHITKILEMAGV